MIWEFPSLKIGDLFVWDSKIPHRNTKNKSCIPRIVSYISLYPISTWKKLGNPNIYDMFAGKNKSLNGENNMDNEEEKKYYTNDWTDRVKLDINNDFVKSLLNL